MHLIMKYHEIRKTVEIESLNEIHSIMIDFQKENSLDDGWYDFEIKGEFKIDKQVKLTRGLGALFG